MKYFLSIWMLLCSITGPLFAQESKTAQIFELPKEFSFDRRFIIDLDKGNKMIIDLSDLHDLERLHNIDSLLQIFSKDLVPLKDSISNELAAYRVDHVTNGLGIRKIRIQHHLPAGNSFLLQGGNALELKMEQDTIIIIGELTHPPSPSRIKINKSFPRYYRLSFYINNIADLENYIDGSLNEKIKTIETNYSGKWIGGKGHNPYTMKTDPSVSAPNPRGAIGTSFDYISLQGSVHLQNYKNYFVPSFGLGASLMLNNRTGNVKHEISLMWEPQFFFSRDSLDRSQTFRNDFLTLTYGQGPVKDKDLKKSTEFNAVFSVGYLIRRKGDFYEKNSFRVGIGRFQWKNTQLEPIMYFNDFFKGITPGLRLIQNF